MITMTFSGFLVIREDDNAYSVRDQNGTLGHVVRHVTDEGRKLFRAFGEDFATLSAAAAEFTKIARARPFDA